MASRVAYSNDATTFFVPLMGMTGPLDIMRYHKDCQPPQFLTELRGDVPPEVRQWLWTQHGIRAQETSGLFFESSHLLPLEVLSVAGYPNQAVNAQQTIAIITRMCTEGFTRHTRHARTLWFACKVLDDIGAPYRIFRKWRCGVVVEYAVVRRDWQPAVTEDQQALRWWDGDQRSVDSLRPARRTAIERAAETMAALRALEGSSEQS